MRAIGTTRWVSAVSAILLELGGCGPRVSVGDLGAAAAAGSAGAASGSNEGGAGAMGEGGGSVTGGGGSAMTSAGKPSGEGGEAPVLGGGGEPGSLPEGCPATLFEFLPINSADCPDTEPAQDSACTSAENSICVWQDGVKGQGGPGYTVLGCYASLEGKVWSGAGQGASGEVGEHPEACPHAVPDAGSSCAGHGGENCYFPSAACSCAADDATWVCEDNVKPIRIPSEVQRLCPPAGVDEAKQIKDLSDAEAVAWCKWYADPTGAPRPPITDNDPPGVAKSYATRYLSFGASACIMELPLEYCVKSLQLRPACTATLAELDDCVESIRGGGAAWVGHGCAPFLANPTCKNVIAQPWEPRAVGLNSCEIPLE